MAADELREVFHLCPEATVQTDPREGVTVHGPHEPLALGRLAPGLRAVLDGLTHAGATGRELLELHRGAAKDEKPTEAIALLGRLARSDRLCRTLEWQGTPLLTARAADASRGRWSTAPEPAALFQLSRFSWLHREGEELWLESPLAQARVLLHDRRVTALLHDLTRPTTSAALSEHAALPPAVVGAVLGMLLVGGLLSRVAPGGAAPEDVEPGPGMWDAVELMAHHRTRQVPRARTPLGKTFPFVDRFEPLPVLAPPRGRERIELPQPDLDDRQRHDPPLAAVMEARRSQRRHGEPPLSLETVGELLYRTLRVRELVPPAEGTRQGRSDRPYPSAGACHPLEAYLAVHRSDGLPAGLYHYHPQHHALYRIDAPAEPVQALLRDAMHASGTDELPQVLLVLTARFGRAAWVYGRLAHRLVLQEVGVVLQSLYLAATAMGVAACALGTGSAARFAALTGLDPRVEASVGEIMLGSAVAAPE